MLEAVRGAARPQLPADSELPGKALPPATLQPYKDLMQACWQPCPEARPSFDDVRLRGLSPVRPW